MRSCFSPALVSSLTFALVFAPAVTAADDSPFAFRGEGYIGDVTVDINDRDDDEFFGGGGATAAANFDGFHFQADFAGNSIGGDRDTDTVGGALRLGWRDPERGSFDLVGTVNNTDFGRRSTDALRLGGEARVFFERITVGIDAGFYDADLSSNANANESAYIDAQIHFYPVESVRLTARGGSSGIDDDDPLALLGFGAEALLHENVGVFSRYDGVFLDANNVEVEDHQLVVGVSLYWGGEGQDLKMYDRTWFNASCRNVALFGRRC